MKTQVQSEVLRLGKDRLDLPSSHHVCQDILLESVLFLLIVVFSY